MTLEEMERKITELEQRIQASEEWIEAPKAFHVVESSTRVALFKSMLEGLIGGIPFGRSAKKRWEKQWGEIVNKLGGLELWMNEEAGKHLEGTDNA